MLTLAIGDLFIPERSIDIPAKFKKLISPNPNNIPSNSKISKVICLGNITNSTSTLRFLKNISPDFQLVKGEFDDPVLVSQQLQLIIENQSQQKQQQQGRRNDVKIPMYSKFTHDNLKIGFTNGYQIMPRGDPMQLSAFARELDVDILVWGGTTRVEAYVMDGKFFINPGSATGAFTFDWPELEDEESSDEEVKEGEKEQAEEVKDDKTEEVKDEKIEEEKGEKNEDEKDEKKEAKEEKDEKNEEVKDEKKEANLKAEYPSTEEVQRAIELNTSIPSFCLLHTQDSTCILYVYTLFDDEVKVDKVTYIKQ
ncbi:uncharacterized protein LODBEIA_P29460 [Lodderomyces beijingensis]|uniref:Vacuolar protein sorting-associated protein 29 n=1 Tax=Lodderomyces beijingensis TaxID=1775926 RepID=A0ABP0ZMW8_9ASCO